MRDIAAIVVTYNRVNLLLRNIESLLSQTLSERFDILVIDNASTDGTGERLQQLIGEGKVKYYNTGSNLGGAGGFQYGIKKAYEDGYSYFWLMDDDTFPYENALEELLKVDEFLDGKYGFLSSVAKWKDGTLCNMNRQRVTYNKPVQEFSGNATKVVMATFVSFFTKREIVEQVGLPIKEFVIWSDDFEYTRRISLLYDCYVADNSVVVHWMNSNNKVAIETESDDRLWRYKLLYRNEMYVYRREGIKGMCYLFARVVLHSARVVVRGTSKWKKIKTIWGSFFSGFGFNPEVECVKSSGN